MTEFVKVSRRPGIYEWEAECETCEGEGRCMVEYAVVDWVHGGYLSAKMDTCPDCDGDGLRPLTEEEEEIVDEMPTLQ